MKKGLVLGSALACGALLLTGCGNNKEYKTLNCTLSRKDTDNGYELSSVYKAYYTESGSKKVVTKVETVETVTSDNESLLKQFEDTLNNTYKTLDEAYGGYDFKVTNQDGKVESKTTINYVDMDLKKLVKENSEMKAYMDSDDNLTYEGVKSMYEAQGATCK